MSNVKPIVKKTVHIKENDLIDLIDGIVNEAVTAKKQEWLTEQATKDTEKATILENRIAALEAKFKIAPKQVTETAKPAPKVAPVAKQPVAAAKK